MLCRTTEHQYYPSDLTDAEWALVEPLLAHGSHRRGKRPTVDRRDIMNALLYRARTGCPWRYLPHEYPNWHTVATCFRTWRIDGRLRAAHAALRAQVR